MAARVIALFLGVFLVANLLGSAFLDGFDESGLLLDLRVFPAAPAGLILCVVAGLLLAWGLFPTPGAARRSATAAASAFALLVAVANVVAFYRLLAVGVIRTDFPVPLSILVAVGSALVLAAVLRQRVSRRRGVLVAVGSGGLFAVLPLLLMFFVGGTDYRRPADVAVVFGARAYADGTPSRALADRVRTAVDLYRAGLVPRILFSGGPGDGGVHETEAMRRLAISLGVPDAAILIDRQGLSTTRTAQNTHAAFAEMGIDTVLAVSHAFHLPRIQMAYRRTGRRVYTVPAEETLPLRQMPWLMAREVVAFWAYWLSPGFGST